MRLAAYVTIKVCLCVSIGVAAAEDFKIDAALGIDTVGVFRGVKSTSLNPSVGAKVYIERGDFFGGMFRAPGLLPSSPASLNTVAQTKTCGR